MIYIHTLIVAMLNLIIVGGNIKEAERSGSKFAKFLALLFSLALFLDLCLMFSYATQQMCDFYFNWLKEVI